MTRPVPFDPGATSVATTTPEARGLRRDGVRLLVSRPGEHSDAHFRDLPDFLAPGTLLVVNRSATLPASLPAAAGESAFRINVSTRYGPDLWLVEPRLSAAEPGPLAIDRGQEINVGGMAARLLSPYPGLPRLWFMHVRGDLEAAMARHGEPIRYSYLQPPYPGLDAYQTIFSRVPGSAEMPSAGRPFTQDVLAALATRGVHIAEIELHTGVSSLEMESDDQPLYGEPFVVPAETAAAVNAVRAAGQPVVAVGTTVVRALESAWDGTGVKPMSGFTRRTIRPDSPVRAVGGLITGFHEPRASHLFMLAAVAGPTLIADAYAEAARRQYLWHEFGDSHLILPRGVPAH